MSSGRACKDVEPDKEGEDIIASAGTLGMLGRCASQSVEPSAASDEQRDWAAAATNSHC